MQFFKFIFILTLSGFAHLANAQVMAGANMNYGTGLMAGQAGNCPTGVQASAAVFKGNEQTRELQRQANQAVAIYKNKQVALKRAKINLTRSENQIGKFFSAGALATIKTHVQGETSGDAENPSTQRLACSAYYINTSKTIVGGDEGDGGSTEAQVAEYQHDPFSENEWKRACPTGAANRSNTMLTSELCKMPNHMRSGSAQNFGSCSKALSDYQRQADQVENLTLQVAEIERELEIVNEQYTLEMDLGAEEFAANGGRSATEGGYCANCDKKKRGGLGDWLSRNTGNIAQILFGGFKYLGARSAVSEIADRNASLGEPTTGITALAVLAGAGDVLNGTMGILSSGSATPGGTHGSFACGGNPAWTGGNSYGNANGYGNANQWMFGNPMANGGANLNTQFNNGFGLSNTNSQFNVNPLLAVNGMSGTSAGYATTSPFNTYGNSNGQVALGANGLLNAFLASGQISAGAGGMQPNIFGNYSNGSIPNTGVGNGGYYGSPQGAMNASGQFAGGAGGFGAGGTLAALLGALSGNGNGNGMFPGQMNGQINGQYGGQQVCTPTGCYMVNGGASAYGQYPGAGMDSAAISAQIQAQQAALAQQQAQLQASFAAEQQRLQNQAAWAQQRNAAQSEFETALAKLKYVDQNGASYLVNQGNVGANFNAQIGFQGQFNSQFGANGQYGPTGPGQYAPPNFGGSPFGNNGQPAIGAPTYNSVLPGQNGDTGARPGR